jgi:hypothetical protein
VVREPELVVRRRARVLHLDPVDGLGALATSRYFASGKRCPGGRGYV